MSVATLFYVENMSTIKTNSPDLDNVDGVLDPWFITGFSDGEAAFTFSRSGNGFALYFSITQREENRVIMEKVRGYFGGIGKIYIRKELLPTKNSGHTKPSAYFRVCKQNELARVIDHFDKFPLQGCKKEVYKIWRDMVIEKARYFLNCDSEQYRVFSEKMSLLNQKSRAFKVHRDNKWLKS